MKIDDNIAHKNNTKATYKFCKDFDNLTII